jgi:ribosomal protein S18 acetylase RimI-like enzyme
MKAGEMESDSRMSITFEKVSRFKRGILLELLADAYSFDGRYKEAWHSNWQTFDQFFYDNLQIADTCGFITTLHSEPIGFVSWDPRKRPEYVEIGHNCIALKHKGRGYGKLQLQEAVNRISQYDVKQIIVTTNDDLIPAQHMYEAVGFSRLRVRKNSSSDDFVNEHIDYVYPLNRCQSGE